MGKRQVKKVEQVPFVEIKEVSFEDFDRTMSKIVKAKLPQTKLPKVEHKTESSTPARPC